MAFIASCGAHYRTASHPSAFSTFLALCRGEDPEIETCLFQVPLAQQIKGRHNDLYDVGFVRSDKVGDGIIAEAVWDDPLMVTLPARHPMLSCKRMPLDEVLRHPLVLGDPQACDAISGKLNGFCAKLIKNRWLPNEWHLLT